MLPRKLFVPRAAAYKNENNSLNTDRHPHYFPTM